jgi:type IV pilus assembly protein PilB
MPYTNPDPQVLKEVGLDSEQLSSIELSRGKGCKECSGTGFKGRVAVYELLPFDDDIRNTINDERFSEVMLRESARKKGMLSLRQEGLRKALEGVTTVEEVLQKTIVLG